MDKLKEISFVLPMFNESQNILRTIDSVSSLAADVAYDHEIVVVDDASTDDSVRVAEEAAKRNSAVKLFKLPVNTKFGGAFARGLEEASMDVIVYMDSDLPVSLEDIKVSLPLIEEYDIVTGVSAIKKGDTLFRKLMSLTYNLLVGVLFGLAIKDINSGYKIIRKKVIQGAEFHSHSPFVDVELFINAKMKNCSVKQFPLIFNQRRGGRSYIASPKIVLATFIDMIKAKIRLLKKK